MKYINKKLIKDLTIELVVGTVVFGTVAGVISIPLSYIKNTPITTDSPKKGIEFYYKNQVNNEFIIPDKTFYVDFKEGELNDTFINNTSGLELSMNVGHYQVVVTKKDSNGNILSVETKTYKNPHQYIKDTTVVVIEVIETHKNENGENIETLSFYSTLIDDKSKELGRRDLLNQKLENIDTLSKTTLNLEKNTKSNKKIT